MHENVLLLEYYDSNLFSVCQPASFNLFGVNNMYVILSVGELLKDNVTKIVWTIFAGFYPIYVTGPQ